MVHVEFWRPGSEIGQSECIATLTQRGHGQPQTEGHEPQVADLERLVLSVSTGEAIRREDDPEEWARSLTGSYRSRTCLPRSPTTITPTDRRSASRKPASASSCASVTDARGDDLIEYTTPRIV
jgi:hypothetical protein